MPKERINSVYISEIGVRTTEHVSARGDEEWSIDNTKSSY